MISPKENNPDKCSSVGITARRKMPTRVMCNNHFDLKNLYIKFYFTITSFFFGKRRRRRKGAQ
jgi:hypothetical protein